MIFLEGRNPLQMLYYQAVFMQHQVGFCALISLSLSRASLSLPISYQRHTIQIPARTFNHTLLSLLYYSNVFPKQKANLSDRMRLLRHRFKTHVYQYQRNSRASLNSVVQKSFTK